MAADHNVREKLEATDTGHFQRLMADDRFKDNPLLPELHQLHDLYCTLSQRTESMIREKSRMETQLANMSRSLDLATRIDPMTGLANRRAIMEMVEQEFSRANRHQRAASIIMADLDYFKKVNDTHGFNTGDDVLVEVSRVLRSCLRNEDICSRWGGEEFLVLLPETTLDGALAVANKIRESVSMTEFKVNRPGIQITISLGVCEYKPDQNIFEAISRADQALHQAKMGGRNRAMVGA
jgi:diguanylate cyclase (GGDEF)-like protein